MKAADSHLMKMVNFPIQKKKRTVVYYWGYPVIKFYSIFRKTFFLIQFLNFSFLHFFGKNCLTLGWYQQRKDHASHLQHRTESQGVGLHLGTKNYKAKSNLFYFVVSVMTFQLGSWQADRGNLSGERSGASEPSLVYVFLYLPNAMVTYLSQRLCLSRNTTLCLL